MTDEKLKRAYRQLTASSRVETLDADMLSALASGAMSDDQRRAYLKTLAESAQNADVARALCALGGDVRDLSADVERLRKPVAPSRRVNRPLRWLALAASFALAGVIGLMLRSPVGPVEDSVVQAQEDASSVVEPVQNSASMIMVASFDSSVPNEAPRSIFVGDFDS